MHRSTDLLVVVERVSQFLNVSREEVALLQLY